MSHALRDDTIEAFTAGFRLVAEHQSAGWWEWLPDGFAGVTLAPLPTTNGIVAASAAFDVGTAADRLDRVRTRPRRPTTSSSAS